MANNYFLRTDVLPEEIPALFSNSSLYSNPEFSEKKIKDHIEKISVHATDSDLLAKICKYGFTNSKPLYYKSRMSQIKTRKMSLMHPGAQIRALYFVLKYEKDILNNMDSNFSFRMPKKRNENTISVKEKKERDFFNLLTIFDIKHGTTSEENILNFRHYFSYIWASNFGSMTSHSKFKETQLMFTYSKKIDLQNFFPSIYTHSLTWALLNSKSIAKEVKNLRKPKTTQYSFETMIDKTMQAINFQETNGIIIGPEFSRMVAELLLTKVDNIVEKNLLVQYDYRNKIDYSIIRYVDDIFIFSNSKELNDSIQKEYASGLESFNLSINDSKIKNYDDTSSILYSKVIELKQIFLNFEKTRVTEFITKKDSLDPEIELIDYLGSQYIWGGFLDNVLYLINSESGRKDNLVNYSLSNLSKFISFSKINTKQITQMLIGFTSLLKINFSFKSVRHYIVLISRILKEIEKNILKEEEELEQAHIITGLNHNQKIIDYIFQHMCNLLLLDWFDSNEGYELITFMDFFKKYNHYVPSHILNIQLKKKDIVNDYFVLSSLTNYIYDFQNYKIHNSYISTNKSILKILLMKLDHYKNEGIDPLNNGNFFYLLNDFYYFPIKESIIRKKLKDIYSSEVTEMQKSILSKHSYYQWGKPFDIFLARILKKKIIDNGFNGDSLTSF